MRARLSRKLLAFREPKCSHPPSGGRLQTGNSPGISWATSCSATQSRVDGDKVFKAWAEFAVGGTWTTTVDGDQKEHTYEWVNGKKFLMLTAKESESPSVAIVGVDPETVF
jgi:hypothetical protein